MLTGTGRGADGLSERGELMVRMQTNYTVQDFAWVGDDLRESWVKGFWGGGGGVYRG